MYFNSLITEEISFGRASAGDCICIKPGTGFSASWEAFAVKEELMGQFGLNVAVPIFWSFLSADMRSRITERRNKALNGCSPYIKQERERLQTSRVFQVMKLPVC